MTMQIRAWTDGSIRELGDDHRRSGPIRAVTIIQYDGGETAKVICEETAVRVNVNNLYIRPLPSAERAEEANNAPADPALPKSPKLKFPTVVADSAYIRIKKRAKAARIEGA
jgi:hypothetical protein